MRQPASTGDSERALRDEIGRIVHDMCNPLMGLLGHAELLRSQPDLPEASRSKVETVLEQARRIQRLVEELNRLVSPAGDRRP